MSIAGIVFWAFIGSLVPMSARAVIVALIDRHPRKGIELRCDDCEQPYGVWFTDNESWNYVMSDGQTTSPEWGGMLCPTCFTERAEHVYHRTAVWYLTREGHQQADLIAAITALRDRARDPKHGGKVTVHEITALLPEEHR